MFNFFEERVIENKDLPSEWKNNLFELEQFLQENWNNRESFYNDNVENKKQQFISFLSHKNIRTNNYVGTIGFNGETINIFPKVFREKYNDYSEENLDIKHLIKNLILWIKYSNKTEYPFINFSSDLDESSNLKELFITLFIKCVDEVLSRNAYYKYENIVEDISTVRGRFNVSDYITKKIPQGKSNRFKCEFSTFEYDNILNRIIKCVCKLLINSTSFDNQKKLRLILMKLNDVTNIKCAPTDCDKINLLKTQQMYKTILSMCKMFLMNQLSSFNIDNNDNFCFLFPTELLFEGFIGGFLSEMLEGKASVTLQKSTDYLFENLFFEGNDYGHFKHLRYDIFIEFYDSKKIFILDTKYKLLTTFKDNPDWESELLYELSSNDVYQVLEYANKNDLRDVYLLYPMIRFEEVEPSYPIGVSYCQSGKTNVHIIKIPFIFEEDEAKMINVLTNELNRILK